MVLVLLPVRAVLADPRVRIDLERETHKKVVVAVTDFVLDDSIADFIGIGKEAKKILEKDLILSEWFSSLRKPAFEELEKMERRIRELESKIKIEKDVLSELEN